VLGDVRTDCQERGVEAAHRLLNVAHLAVELDAHAQRDDALHLGASRP
jgi:hypothetical protein